MFRISEKIIFFPNSILLYQSEIFSRFQKSHLEHRATNLKLRKIKNQKFWVKTMNFDDLRNLLRGATVNRFTMKNIFTFFPPLRGEKYITNP